MDPQTAAGLSGSGRLATVSEPRAPGGGASDPGHAEILRAGHRSPGAVLAAAARYRAADLAGVHSGAVRGSRGAQGLPLYGAEVGLTLYWPHAIPCDPFHGSVRRGRHS